MATAVFFHAHPDDESITTAGVMIRAAADGHRVVLVTATDGSLGEAPDGAIPEGSTLADVRAAELADAAAELGVHRLEMLGYRDSGMEGEPSNDDPESFWRTPVEFAAARLAAILEEESAELLTIYDSHGGYGHPDHVQVHRVGVRAAEMAGVGAVFEATMNRDHMRMLAELIIDEAEMTPEFEQQQAELRETDMGSPAELITHAIDVSGVIAQKRRALIAHRSQVTEDSFFLTMPDEAFVVAFGTEWFVHRGAERTGEPFGDDIFAVLTDR